MSNPKNPLSNFNSYDTKHVLLAFDNSIAASQYQGGEGDVGMCGSQVEKVSTGKAFVIVNEIKDTSYFITNLVWSFDFFSPTSSSTTISAGFLTIADAFGNMFPNFLRSIAQKLGCAETGLTFHLTTHFNGRSLDSQYDYDRIVTKPLIFSLMDTTTGFKDGLSNLFTMNFANLYNTVGQLPSFSQLNQFTITHSENDPSRSIPNTAGGTLKILSRKEEEQVKKNPRLARIAKSKPMRTLKELFSGFETELKESKYENKRQLQEFISVYTPDAIKKIKAPKQKKGGGNGIPIDFTIKIDPAYVDYAVDNRNLAFEQVEQNQGRAGITSMTVAPGSTILSTIDNIMKTSKAVAKDVDAGYSFKSVITTMLDAEGVVRNSINVRRYLTPHNEQFVKDTGSTDKLGVVKTPLEINYATGNDTDLDIFSINYASGPAVRLNVMEEDEDNMEGASVVLGDREAVSFERAGELDFRKSGYCGLRVGSNPSNSGLESAASGVKIDASKHRFVTAQSALTVVKILGNSDLYSDLARNPLSVAEGKEDGATIYKFPEYYPMYVKLNIRVSSNLGPSVPNTSPNEDGMFYHTCHYHLSGVTNEIRGGRFVQTLRLLSTDDVT